MVDALANWQRGRAQDKATIRNRLLYPANPKLTVDEWMARFATEH